RGAFPGTLDWGLKQQAIQSGVSFSFGQKLPYDEVDVVATGPIKGETAAIDKGIIFKTTAPDCAIALVDDRAAYLGYSYLLITQGYGCICTVLFDEFHRLNDCFEETKKNLCSLLGLDDLREQKAVGGLGSFSTHLQPVSGNTLFVGEAAGLQDLLWGFGIRSSMMSGFIAANCLLEQKDYAQILLKKYRNYLKAGVVNRFAWERIRKKGMPKIFCRIMQGKASMDLLHSIYNYNLSQKFLYPFARRYLKKRYPQLRL
ncbi:hypothetical protein JYU14_01245, partial [Simkania negevensis]|nr:hypothetical protein [Simkania negevensis]